MYIIIMILKRVYCDVVFCVPIVWLIIVTVMMHSITNGDKNFIMLEVFFSLFQILYHLIYHYVAARQCGHIHITFDSETVTEWAIDVTHRDKGA